MRVRVLLLVPLLCASLACRDSRSPSSVATTTTATSATVTTTTTTTTTTTAATTTTTTAATTTTATTTIAPATDPIGATIDGSIDTPDGRTRTYRLYVPSALPAGPVPLVLAFHGGTGWGAQFQRTSGFDGLAEANGFLVVFPDGVGIGPAAADLRTWNAGYCCGPAARQDVDDVEFVRLLIDAIEAEYTIDPTRVFAAGHSNGGMLSYRLACELSDRIAAVGLQAGSLGVDECEPTQPVSLLHVHGTADSNHPIEGGEGSNSISGVSYRSADESVRTVAAAMSCDSEPAVATDPENADVEIRTWGSCTGSAEVELAVVRGATHAWMGHPTINPNAEPPYADLDASVVVLRFLLAHPRIT